MSSGSESTAPLRRPHSANPYHPVHSGSTVNGSVSDSSSRSVSCGRTYQSPSSAVFKEVQRMQRLFSDLRGHGVINLGTVTIQNKKYDVEIVLLDEDSAVCPEHMQELAKAIFRQEAEASPFVQSKSEESGSETDTEEEAPKLSDRTIFDRLVGHMFTQIMAKQKELEESSEMFLEFTNHPPSATARLDGPQINIISDRGVFSSEVKENERLFTFHNLGSPEAEAYELDSDLQVEDSDPESGIIERVENLFKAFGVIYIKLTQVMQAPEVGLQKIGPEKIQRLAAQRKQEEATSSSGTEASQVDPTRRAKYGRSKSKKS